MSSPAASRLRSVDAWLMLALFGGTLGILLTTAGTLGYARDEGFYFQAASSYEKWFELLWQDPSRAILPQVVDSYWGVNHEHPAFVKSLFALSHHFFYTRWHWLREAGTAYRFPGMALSALAVSVVYVWGRWTVGRVAALVGALLLMAMPRVFYHAHLDCFDMPVASLWLVTTYAYWRSLAARGLAWPLVTGFLYGLLLNTKHNSWLLPGAFFLHLLLTRARAGWQELLRGRVTLPAAWVAMLTLGPVVFYLGWPWIWHDTARRLSDYLEFHLHHEYYNMEFLGRTYWKPPMPRLYAWVMTLATVPGITLVLSGVGLAELTGYSRRSQLAPGKRDTYLLWLVCLAVSYAPWLSTRTPIFGGTKHWLTAYPFLALFAALGFHRVYRELSGLLPQRWLRKLPYLETALASSVLAAPFAMSWHSHPWGLSAYTPLVGGASGAASLGLNRTFWGYTTLALGDFLNQRLRPRAVLFVHDTALQSYGMLRQDSRVRPDLSPTLDISASDYALYHHEQHMSRVEHQIWVDYGTTAPVQLGAYDGVPVVWLYERPSPRVP